MFLVTLLLCSPAVIMAEQTKYIDADALVGVKKTKTVFDINLAEASKLKLYLQVIGMTLDDLLQQEVDPEMIITFRGPSVRLINTERWSFSEDDQKSLKTSADLIAELQKKGITIEACSIATNLFKIDNATLLPGIKVVGNTFVSLTGYQTRGYALIPIM